jgi:hypothetical protein
MKSQFLKTTVRTRLQRPALLALPLVGLLVSACSAHERYPHNRGALHGEFRAYPSANAEHRQFHEDLRGLHDYAHERGFYGDRYYDRAYYGDGRYYLKFDSVR